MTATGQTSAKAETRTTSIVLPEDIEEAVRRFQRDDVRPTFNNAVLALIVAGLEANRRRKPLRAAAEAQP